MPTLLTQTEVKLEWADINNRRRREDPKPLKRSNGVHLSGVTKYVLETSGMLTPRDKTDEFPLCMAIGLAWEAWAVGLWPNMIWQPGECHLDGITGSPDGITKIKEPYLLEEFKATWKSGHPDGKYGNILEQKMWLWQLQGYCKMLKLRRARIHILWINGGYEHMRRDQEGKKKDGPTPKYATYTLEFTQLELDKFWANVVLKNKDKAPPEKH